jgi:Zn-dependent peptidase ImmA (M78 family)
MNTTLLSSLRTVIPARPLTLSEGLRLAELQATKLLAAQGVFRAPVRETVITRIPRIRVTRENHIPISGATHWSRGVWAITVCADESLTRQLFTMAHEFKHALDAPTADLLYPPIRDMTSEARAEQVCDYFAACLLMPRAWVKRAVYGGTSDPVQLAEMFGVSQPAMRRRLQALGLVDRAPRCLVG